MKEEYKLIYKTKDKEIVPIEEWRAKLIEILNKMNKEK